MTSARGENYTVLIVDDDPELLQLLTDGLEMLGSFKVVQAVDGIQGLEQYFAAHPDCVIIDVVMPGLDGYQLVKALRGDPASAETPLIMLTALAQDKDEFLGLAAGADQYLVKPIKLRNLVDAVHRAVKITSAERQKQLLALAEKQDTGDSGE
ncbi:MAG TPA: response regulator [Ktedonobacterales bacterium]|nr:response regulator [Ktedonobacterales bacterium]